MKKDFIYFSRCGRFGVYAEYGALVVRTYESAPEWFYRNGFLFLIKSSILFNFLVISKLYYNIMSMFLAPKNSELYIVCKEIMIKILLLFDFEKNHLDGKVGFWSKKEEL
ncbi:MAG: hypothetical protein ACP5SD_10375 [Elusimicrobiales bacterium]